MSELPKPEELAALRGAGGGGKGEDEKTRTAVEDPDTLQSIAYANLIDVISEGEIGGLVDGLKSVYLGGVPLVSQDGVNNFTGVTLDTRVGTQAQTYMPGFPSVQATDTLGAQVRYGIPVVHQIDNPDANAVYVTVAVDALYEQDTSNGDVHGASVNMRIEYQAHGAGYVIANDFTITGKTRSRYQRGVRVDLAGTGPWTVRVSRLSQDSASSALANNTYFDFCTTIVDQKFRYPNTALIGIQIDARQFSSIPERAYLINGIKIKVPNNYDPDTRAYSGIWDGGFKVVFSNNPAWCYYDMLTSERYGLGQYIDVSQVDKAAIYTIGQYCDEMVDDGFGGLEPRFAMNCVLQARNDAYKVIQDLASVFRGMTYWSAGTLVAVQDGPRSAVKKFSPANVLNGSFQYVGSQMKDRHSVCTVTWNDPDDTYKQATEYVELPDALARYGYKPTDMVAFGCTSRGQAHRVGLWALWSEYVDTDQLTFQVALEGAALLPGEIIMVANPLRQGQRMSGRVNSSTTITAELDAPVSFVAGYAYYFYYVDATGTDRNIGLINPGTTSTSTVHFVSPVPSTQLPQISDMWLVAGVNLLEPEKFRVIGVKESAKNVFDVSAVTYTEAKYAAIDSGTLLELPPTSIGDGLIALTPTNFAVFDTTYVMAPGLLGSKLVLSWSGNTPQYIIQWRDSGGVWFSDTVGSPGYELYGVTEGHPYDFRIYGVAANGKKSTALESTYTVIGKTAPPGPCTQLQATGAYTEIDLTWTNPPDLDLAYVEILESTSNDPTTAVVAGRSMTQEFARVGLNTGGKITRYYWVRAVDTSGNVGPLNSNLGTVATTILVSTSDFDGEIQSDQLAQDVISDITQIVLDTAGPGLALVVADQLIGLTADSDTVTADDDTHYAGDTTVFTRLLENDLALDNKLELQAARINENVAAISTESQVRADADTALSTRVDQVAAQTGLVGAAVTAETEARTSADEAFASQIDTLTVDFNGSIAAAIQTEQTARANADTAQAQATQTLQATVGTNTSAIQTQATAVATLDGNMQATYTIKAQVSAGGVLYAAGMGLGVYNSPGGVQTSVYFLADRFSLLNLNNGVATTPFIVDSGITYIRAAMIQDATITNAKIANAAITNAKIADANITAAKIANAQILNAHIIDAQIDRLKIAGTSVTTSAAFDFGYWSGQVWDGNWRDRGYGVISIPENAHLLIAIVNGLDEGATFEPSLGQGEYGAQRVMEFRLLLNGGEYGNSRATIPSEREALGDDGAGGPGSYRYTPQTYWSFNWAQFNFSGNVSITIQYRLRNEFSVARSINSSTRIFALTAYR